MDERKGKPQQFIRANGFAEGTGILIKKGSWRFQVWLFWAFEFFPCVFLPQSDDMILVINKWSLSVHCARNLHLEDRLIWKTSSIQQFPKNTHFQLLLWRAKNLNVSRYSPVPDSEGSGLCTLLQWGAARLSQSYWLFPIQLNQQGGVWSGSRWCSPVHVSLRAQWKYNGIVWRPDSLESGEGK